MIERRLALTSRLSSWCPLQNKFCYQIRDCSSRTISARWPPVRSETTVGLGIRAISSSRQAGVKVVSSSDRIGRIFAVAGAVGM